MKYYLEVKHSELWDLTKLRDMKNFLGKKFSYSKTSKYSTCRMQISMESNEITKLFLSLQKVHRDLSV